VDYHSRLVGDRFALRGAVALVASGVAMLATSPAMRDLLSAR
jgi:hypothetical protein